MRRGRGGRTGPRPRAFSSGRRLRHARGQTASPGCFHERPEWKQLFGVPLEHQLGVPLHTQNEGSLRERYGFDQPVWSMARDLQPLPNVFDRLMMVGIDADTTFSVDPFQWRTHGGENVMGRIVRVQTSFVLAMLHSIRILVRDVLEEGAAKGDVKDLDAAADAEEWQISGKGTCDEIKLELIAEGMDTIGCRMDKVLTEAGRSEVTAATQQEPVNETQQGIRVTLLRRKDDGNTSCGFDRRHVRDRHRVAGEGAVRECIHGRGGRNSDHRLHPGHPFFGDLPVADDQQGDRFTRRCGPQRAQDHLV